MRTRIIVAALAALMLASIPAIVQAAPFDRYLILANTQPGNTPVQLELRQTAGSFTQVEGAIGNDLIEGFFATDSRQIVWVRFSRRVATQVFVGAYTEQNMGRLGVSREIRGTVYALNAAGGASDQRNAFGFRAWNNRVFQRREVPPSRSADPANSLNPHREPTGPWWITANTAQSVMVLEVAGGAVSGRLLGDPIVGHYAVAAGTISFLRLQNGRPAQFYQAVSVRRPMAGGALEFDGSLVALNLEGGASEFDIDFPFKAENEGGFFTYRSVANGRCLEIANAALGDRAQLRLGTCTPGATHQQFGSVRTAGNGATVMVARHSGRCLDIPNGITNPSTHVQQYLCHGQPNQQAGWQAVHQGSCPRGFQFCHSIRFFLNPPACLEVSGIEARIEARTGIATSERCSSSRPGIEFDHEFVP